MDAPQRASTIAVAVVKRSPTWNSSNLNKFDTDVAFNDFDLSILDLLAGSAIAKLFPKVKFPSVCRRAALDLGAKYLVFVSSPSLKTREKYINFAQFV